MSAQTNFRRTSRSATALVTAVALAVGGCGGGEIRLSVPHTKPAVKPLTLSKSAYTSGESISLAVLPSPATSAALTFADGQRFSVPLMPDGSVMVPVVTSALAGQAVQLSVVTAQGEYQSADLRLQQIVVGTSKPGIATLVYLQTSIAHLDSAIDEMMTLSANPLVPEAAELLAMRASLEQLHIAVESAQAGTPVELTAAGAAQKLYIDGAQLAVFDQYILALMKTTAKAVPAAAAGMPAAFARPAAGLTDTRLAAAVTSSPIPSRDCVAIIGIDTTPEDQGFCRNMQAQLTSDVLIHAAGMVGTVGGLVAGSLVALTALGVVSLGGTALVIGAASIATIVIANLIGTALQGASAYGTGTTKGIDVRENIKNLIDVARSLVVGQIAKLFPNGGSELYKQLYGAVRELVSSKLFDLYDKFIADVTKQVSGCTAQATSGGQGSFAGRYDFGSARALRLTYDAFSVPDQFTITDGSGMLGGTAGLVSGTGTILVTTTGNFVTVKVNAPNAGTGWNYSITCAN